MLPSSLSIGQFSSCTKNPKEPLDRVLLFVGPRTRVLHLVALLSFGDLAWDLQQSSLFSCWVSCGSQTKGGANKNLSWGGGYFYSDAFGLFLNLTSECSNCSIILFVFLPFWNSSTNLLLILNLTAELQFGDFMIWVTLIR